MTIRTTIMRYNKTCPECGQQFTSNRPGAIYCSAACIAHAYRARRAARQDWQPTARQDQNKIPAQVAGVDCWLYPVFNREDVLMVAQEGYVFRSAAGTTFHLSKARVEQGRRGERLPSLIGSRSESPASPTPAPASNRVDLRAQMQLMAGQQPKTDEEIRAMIARKNTQKAR